MKQIDYGEDTEFLDERVVARELNMSVKWLQKRRVHGGGPVFHKFGRRVRYSRANVSAYVFAQARRSTSDTD